MRRKETRQDYARRKEREEAQEARRTAEDEYYKVQSKVEAKRKEEEEKEEESKREKQHQEWLQRENVAIGELKKKKEEEEERLKTKLESEQKIRDEWTVKIKMEHDIKEANEAKQATLKKEMNNLHQQNSTVKRFHNPEMYNPELFNPNLAPTNWNNIPSELFGTEQDPRNCKFYIKTGACRFGPRCSRIHLKYDKSTTIMIPNFFHDARLAIPMLNERNNDSAIEYDEVELIHEFESFYDDVIGEFRSAGNLIMFKCCQNYVPHLRGNVYVQYQKHEEAKTALNIFNGRFYAGRQLSVELSPVSNWKSSICGLFDKRLCPRGKACNFLHVFRNPGNAYSVPNRTDFDPERARRSGGYDPNFVNLNHPVFNYYNKRDSYGYRSDDIRPAHSTTNKWDKTQYERSRSKSRDRDRRRKRYSRSRSRSRGRSRSRSRSYSGSRSRSRSRRKRRSRSRTRSRSHSKDRSRRSRRDSRGHSKSSNSSHGSRKKERKGSDAPSDTSTDWSDLSED